MLSVKILTLLAVMGISLTDNLADAKTYDGKITHECMRTSEEYGDSDVPDDKVNFVSNMSDIVSLGEKALFMRTNGIMVCSGPQYIHSVRISLMHDPAKDPDHNEALDTFYSKTKASNRDRTYYGQMLGEQNGDCETLELEEGERVEAMMIYHSRGLTRNLEFKLSNGTTKLLGKHRDRTSGLLQQEIINFSHGEEILGFYGKTVAETIKTMHGPLHNKHFVSFGVIVNECDTYSLSQFSSKIT